MDREHVFRVIAERLRETGCVTDRKDKADFITYLADQIPGFGRRFGTLDEITHEEIVRDTFDTNALQVMIDVIEKSGLFRLGMPEVIRLLELINQIRDAGDTKAKVVRLLSEQIGHQYLYRWHSCYLAAAGFGAPDPPRSEPVAAFELILDSDVGGPRVAYEFVERLRRLVPAAERESFTATADKIGAMLELPEHTRAEIRYHVERGPVDARLFISILMHPDRKGADAYWSWRAVNGTDPRAGYDDGDGFKYLNSTEKLDMNVNATLARLLQLRSKEEEPIGTVANLLEDPDLDIGIRPIFEVIVARPEELDLRFDKVKVRGGQLGSVAPLVVRPPVDAKRDNAMLDGRCARWASLNTIPPDPGIREIRRKQVGRAEAMAKANPKLLGFAFSDGSPTTEAVTRLVAMGIPVVLWSRNGESVTSLIERDIRDLPDRLFEKQKIGKFVLVWDNPFWEIPDHILERVS